MKILLLSFVSSGTQVAALVVIVNLVDVLSSGGLFQYQEYSFQVQMTLGNVLLLAMVPAALLIVATVSMYTARRMIARLMIDYSRSLERAIYKGVALRARFHADHEQVAIEELVAMVGKDGRFAGRVVNEITSSFVPFMSMLIVLPVLAFLDWQLSAVLAGLMLGSLVVYGAVGRRGARVSIELEEAGPGASRQKIGLLRNVIATAPPDARVERLVDQLCVDHRPTDFLSDPLCLPRLEFKNFLQ